MIAHTRPSTRNMLFAASVLALGLGLTACTPAASAPESGDKSSASPAASAAAPAGCEQAATIDSLVVKQVGAPTDDGLRAVAAAYQAAGDALHGGPAAPHEAAHTAAQLITQSVDDGAGAAVFEDPAYVQSATTLGKFVFDECGYGTVAITAKDFQFDGIPDEVPAGMTAVQLTNKGESPHVIEFSRIPDPATTTTQIMADLGAAMKSGLVQMVSGGAFSMPESAGYTTVDLAPGRYLVTCMIPDSQNMPHAMHGMFHELTVK